MQEQINEVLKYYQDFNSDPESESMVIHTKDSIVFSSSWGTHIRAFFERVSPNDIESIQILNQNGIVVHVKKNAFRSVVHAFSVTNK